MSTRRLDQRNLFNAEAAGISDGLEIGPSAFINGDGSCATLVLGNDAGAEVVIEARRAPEVANTDTDSGAWFKVGDAITSGDMRVRRMLAGFQYRANMLKAGDGSEPVVFSVQEEPGSNVAYQAGGGDQDIGRCRPGGFSTGIGVALSTQINGDLQDLTDALSCDPVEAQGVVDSWN